MLNKMINIISQLDSNELVRVQEVVEFALKTRIVEEINQKMQGKVIFGDRMHAIYNEKHGTTAFVVGNMVTYININTDVDVLLRCHKIMMKNLE